MCVRFLKWTRYGFHSYNFIVYICFKSEEKMENKVKPSKNHSSPLHRRLKTPGNLKIYLNSISWFPNQWWAAAHPKIFSAPVWSTLYDFKVFLLKIMTLLSNISKRKRVIEVLEIGWYYIR